MEIFDVWRVVAAVFWPNTMKSHWLNYFTSEQTMARTAQSENKSSRVLSIGVVNDENECVGTICDSLILTNIISATDVQKG